MIKINLFFLLLIFFLFNTSYTQTYKGNSAVIEDLFISSINNHLEKFSFSDKSIFINFTNFEKLDWLKNSTNEYFISKNSILTKSDSSEYYLGLKIDSVKIDFPNFTSTGFLEERKLQRQSEISFVISFFNQKEPIQRFSEKCQQSIIDTINVSDYFEFSNSSKFVPTGELPKATFLNSLIEPILFVSTTSALVILLFSTRSK